MKNDKMIEKYVCGHAFEFYHPKNSNYGIKTYSVIDINNQLQFNKLSENIFDDKYTYLKTTKNLLENGYKPLEEWAKLVKINYNKVLTKKK